LLVQPKATAGARLSLQAEPSGRAAGDEDFGERSAIDVMGVNDDFISRYRRWSILFMTVAAVTVAWLWYSVFVTNA